MRLKIYFTTLMLILAFAVQGYSKNRPSLVRRHHVIIRIAHIAQVPRCDPNLWQHVYHALRLQPRLGCITVTGAIVLERTEPDGDIHIQLRLDPGLRRLLNARNQVAGWEFGR